MLDMQRIKELWHKLSFWGKNTDCFSKNPLFYMDFFYCNYFAVSIYFLFEIDDIYGQP